MRVLFGASTDGRAERRLDALASDDPDPTGLFVARDGAGRACGAMLVQAMRGGLGVAWPPRGENADVENALVIAASNWLRERGAKVCQAFATVDEHPKTIPLERNGFRRITQLVFMRGETTSSTPRCTPSTCPLAFVADALPFTEAFRTTLLATHEGTLDCPELNLGRTNDELLVGFTDVTPGTEWYLAIHDNAPIGVVVLAPGAEPKTGELSYLGVVPAVRGRGFGAELVKFATAQALISQASALTLSVDGRNEPALRLYRQHGFVETDRREVFLARWCG
jgi:ribosomal protein S18 acetylase RimI-like enzyme